MRARARVHSKCRFHDVEPQPFLEAVPPHKLSARIVAEAPRAVPAPLLMENTLVLSDEGVVAPRDGKLFLMFRCVRAQCKKTAVHVCVGTCCTNKLKQGRAHACRHRAYNKKYVADEAICWICCAGGLFQLVCGILLPLLDLTWHAARPFCIVYGFLCQKP